MLLIWPSGRKPGFYWLPLIYTYWIMRNKNCTHMHHLWKMQNNALTHCGYSFKKITLWMHLVLISYKYISSYQHIHVFVMFKQFWWPLMSPSSVVEWFTTRCHNGEQRVICVTELVRPSSLFMGAFSFRMHIASFMSLPGYLSLYLSETV